MTDHIDVESLSAFADSELSAVNAQRVERHLAECDQCRVALERVRALVKSASSLPRDVAPPPAAWQEIRARLSSRAARPERRRWWHSGWLASAAAVVLVAGTATLMLLARPTDQAKAAKFASAPVTPPTPAVVASVERNYVPTLTELRATFETQRLALAPSTVRTLDHSLAVIDSAIAEARAALLADPASARLTEMLAGYYQRKVEFLKRANTLTSSL